MNLKELIISLANGDINFITGLIWIIIATALSMIGGAIGGIILVGREFGYNFAATIGGLFGPAGVVPAILLGLMILKLFGN